MDTSLGIFPLRTPATAVALGHSAPGGVAGSPRAGAFSPTAVRDAQQGDARSTSAQFAAFRGLASSSSVSSVAAPTGNSALALLASMSQQPSPLQLPPVQPQSNGNQNQPQQGDLIPIGVDLGGDDE